MKKITLLFTFCFVAIQAQVETEGVYFETYTSETDNDFVNNFYYSESTDEPFINQRTYGGTGGGVVEQPLGALEVSNSVSWGNDTFVYNTNYKNVLNEVLETSISFKYEVNLNEENNQKPIAIWLRNPMNNKDVGFYLNADQTLSIISDNYDESTQLSISSDGNEKWHKLVVKYQSIGGDSGNEIYVSAEIFNLGFHGLNSAGVLIGSHEATIHDADLINSSEFEIHLSASKQGGSEYLDNFIFKGVKGSDNTLGATSYDKTLSEVLVYPNPTSDLLTIQSEENIKDIEIIDLTGRTIVNTKELNIDVSKLISGNYIVKTNFSNGASSEKRIIKLD